MSQYPWISAEATPSTTGGDKEMAIRDKGEDPLPEETYLLQDIEAPLDALTVGMRDTTHATALKRNSYPATRGNKPTLSTWRKKENRTMKCRMPKNQTQWHQFMPNWNACPWKTRCIWQKKWESLRIFPQPD